MVKKLAKAILIVNILILVGLASTGWTRDLAIISTGELKAKLDSGESLFLLNPLSDIEFNERHIPGSINIPLHSIMESDQLPQNKDTLIVTYCLGPK